MELTEYKVIGIDETRPPRLQREPCIDLVFELNETAPADWCREFLLAIGKSRYPIKIDPEEGQFIETWVRDPREIEAYLELIKGYVVKGNEAYRALLERNRDVPEETDTVVTISPEQKNLNDIVRGLKFEA